MLKKMVCFLTFILVVSPLVAQDFGNIELLMDAGLKKEIIEKIIDINVKYQQEIQEAELELNIYKAQLEKLLFLRDVDLKKVEQLLRDSMEWKLKAEMARIKRRAAIRLLIDEDKWLHLVQYLRATRINELREKKNEE